MRPLERAGSQHLSQGNVDQREARDSGRFSIQSLVPFPSAASPQDSPHGEGGDPPCLGSVWVPLRPSEGTGLLGQMGTIDLMTRAETALVLRGGW